MLMDAHSAYQLVSSQPAARAAAAALAAAVRQPGKALCGLADSGCRTTQRATFSCVASLDLAACSADAAARPNAAARHVRPLHCAPALALSGGCAAIRCAGGRCAARRVRRQCLPERPAGLLLRSAARAGLDRLQVSVDRSQRLIALPKAHNTRKWPDLPRVSSRVERP